MIAMIIERQFTVEVIKLSARKKKYLMIYLYSVSTFLSKHLDTQIFKSVSWVEQKFRVLNA